MAHRVVACGSFSRRWLARMHRRVAYRERRASPRESRCVRQAAKASAGARASRRQIGGISIAKSIIGAASASSGGRRISMANSSMAANRTRARRRQNGGRGSRRKRRHQARGSGGTRRRNLLSAYPAAATNQHRGGGVSQHQETLTLGIGIKSGKRHRQMAKISIGAIKRQSRAWRHR